MNTKTKKILVTIAMLIPGLIALAPFYLMFIMGTHNTAEIYRGEFYLPGIHVVKNFKTVLEAGFDRYYINSLYISIVTTFLSVLTSALAGFALAKYDFKLQKFLFFFIISTMMIPNQLGLVGFVMEMRVLNLNNTHVPLIIIFIANAFGVFWMTQFIRGNVPTEVVESARVDGCREIGIFVRIIIPYIRPAIITLCMMIFLWSWNNYMLPLIVINSDELYTIPLALSKLNTGNYGTDMGAKLMALSIGTIPLVIIFIFGSGYFIRGLTAGAIKG